MLEIIENIKNIILNLSMFLPFILSGILGIGFFVKNPIHIRNISNTFLVFNFIVISCVLFLINKTDFSLFNLNFSLNSTSSLILLFTALIFMLFSIFSKNIISKSHRAFYSTLILLLGIIQGFILTDNIFISLSSIFLILLIFYFMQNIFINPTKKTNILKFKLIEDCFIFLLAFFLMGYDFIRYFLINNINLSYSNIINNLYHISDFSATLAFIGFLILIFRFFNFIPFNNSIKHLTISNNYISIINTISCALIGLVLLFKIYPSFDYLIYHYQEYIAFYLIFNFMYYIILSFRANSVINFFKNSIIPNIIIGLFVLFIFNSDGISQFIYYILSLIISYLLLGFIITVLINKFKTDLIEDFKKITQKSLLLIFLFSILNLIRTPFLLMFSTTFIVLSSIFSFDYEGIILNLSGYILLVGLFMINLAMLNFANKIIIEPIEKPDFKFFTIKSNLFCFYILIFLTIIMTLGYQYIYDLMVNSFSFGS